MAVAAGSRPIVVTGTSRRSAMRGRTARRGDAVARATTSARCGLKEPRTVGRHPEEARTAIAAGSSARPRASSRQFHDDRRHGRAAPRAHAARALAGRVRRARRAPGQRHKGPADLAAGRPARARRPPPVRALVAVYLDCARLGTAGDDLARRSRPRCRRAARRSRRSSTRPAARSSPRSRTAASARPRWSTSRSGDRGIAPAPTRARSTSWATMRQPGGTLTPLKFSATTERLSSLVAELKQAVRQVEVLCE